jgi:hypothetical protein
MDIFSWLQLYTPFEPGTLLIDVRNQYIQETSRTVSPEYLALNLRHLGYRIRRGTIALPDPQNP